LNQDSNEFPDWLKGELQCPSCNRVMTEGPIHLCKKNQEHAICFKCYEDNKSCPVCQGEMMKKRNLMVERIVRNIPKDQREEASVSEIPAWMKKALECPVCLDTIMDPPVFVCENSQGHSVCSTCHNSIKKNDRVCPVCRSRMTQRRNVAMESMLEGIPNKIKCRFDGCDVRRSTEVAVKKHEEECENRYVPCAGCDDSKIGQKRLAEHFIKEHRDGKRDLDNRQFNITYSMLSQSGAKGQDVYFMTDGRGPQTFLLNSCSLDRNCRLVWIAHIGPKESAYNFKYTIKVLDNKEYNAGREKFVAEATRHCVPCDLSHKDVTDKLCGVVLDKDTIDQAITGEGRLRYNLTIFKA